TARTHVLERGPGPLDVSLRELVLPVAVTLAVEEGHDPIVQLDGGWTFFGMARRRSDAERLELRRNRALRNAHRRPRLHADAERLVQRGLGAVRVELLQRQELEECRAEGVDVRRGPNQLTTSLLRGHVADRSDQVARLRHFAGPVSGADDARLTV